MDYRRNEDGLALAILLGMAMTCMAGSPLPGARDAGVVRSDDTYVTGLSLGSRGEVEGGRALAADEVASKNNPTNPIRPWTMPGTRTTAEPKGGNAQSAPFIKENGIIWAKGQGEGLLGGIARVKIDAGARLTEVRGVRTWLTQRNLPVVGNEIGLIVGPKGLWNALVVLLPVTNVQPAQVAQQLPQLASDALPRLAQSFASAPNRPGDAATRLDWITEPRIDESGQSMQWCLERNMEGRSQLLPGAAFFTTRGIVVLHFFGSPDLIPGICFGTLRNISILRSAPSGNAGTFSERVLTQIVSEPRIVKLGQRAANVPSSKTSVVVAPTNHAVDKPASVVSSEVDSGSERRLGDNTDQIVLGMLAVVGLVILGLLLGTTPVKRGRRRRRSDPSPGGRPVG